MSKAPQLKPYLLSIAVCFALLLGTVEPIKASDSLGIEGYSIWPHPDEFSLVRIGLAQDYLWRNAQLARVAGHADSGPRTVLGSRIIHAQNFGSRWILKFAADLFIDFRRDGGQILGEQSYVNLRAADIDWEPNVPADDVYFLGRIGQLYLQYDFGDISSRIGRLEAPYHNFHPNWLDVAIQQVRLPLHRSAQHSAFIDGVQFTLMRWADTFLSSRIGYDHVQGWGGQVTFVNFTALSNKRSSPTVLFTKIDVGWFDDLAGASVHSRIVVDNSSAVFARLRIAKHSAVSDVNGLFQTGIMSRYLGPELQLEYLFNSAGAVDRSAYNLVALLEGRLAFLDRHYLRAAAVIDITGELEARAATLLNLRDFSQSIDVSLRRALAGEQLGISLAGRLSMGQTLDDAWYYADWIGVSLDFQLAKKSPLLGDYL